MSGKKFKVVHLFIDASVRMPKSHQIVNFIEKNLKMINFNGLIVEMVPIMSDNDKGVLLQNGVKKLPTLLDGPRPSVGVDAVMNFLASYARQNKQKYQKDEADVLREAQMAEMDMEKFEAGEYDDEDDFDDDDIFHGGDRDTVEQNIQRRVGEFNKRRTGRTEEDTEKPKKGSKRKKSKRGAKPKRPTPMDDDDDDDDNIAPPPPRGGKKPTSTRVNPDEWDAETAQLLDKGGGDW